MHPSRSPPRPRGISERSTLKSWTVLESVLSLAGLAVGLVLSAFV